MTDKSEDGVKGAESAEYLRDLIDLPRVKILSEDETSFLIEYEGQEIPVVKSDATYFQAEAAGSVRNGMRQELRLVAALDEKICQDDGAREFMEVMLFHELREREYLDAGFENPHQRAVHDEILYVMAHLPEKLREYLEFAKQYREERAHPVDAEEGANEEQVAEEREIIIEQQRKEREEGEAAMRAKAANEKERMEESLMRINEIMSFNPAFIPISVDSARLPDCEDLLIRGNKYDYTITVFMPGVRKDTIAYISSCLKGSASDEKIKHIWEEYFASGNLELPIYTAPEKIRKIYNAMQRDIMKTRKLIEKMAEMGFVVDDKDKDYAFIVFKDQMKMGDKQFISIIFEVIGDTYWTSITVNRTQVKRGKRKAQSLGKKHGAKQVIYEEYDHNEANAVFKFDLDDLDNAIRLYGELKEVFKS